MKVVLWAGGDRITHARKTAIVLYDFCMSLGIPITIYGHSTDSKGVALYSYAEFDSLDASDRYRLMDMSARNGNRDGAALRYVAEHLAKRPESQKLLIIILTDSPQIVGTVVRKQKQIFVVSRMNIVNVAL